MKTSSNHENKRTREQENSSGQLVSSGGRATVILKPKVEERE